MSYFAAWIHRVMVLDLTSHQFCHGLAGIKHPDSCQTQHSPMLYSLCVIGNWWVYFLSATGKNCVASLRVLVRLYWVSWLIRSQMHDCGLDMFMLRWLVSAHLIGLSVLVTVWSITLVGFRLCSVCRGLFVLLGSLYRKFQTSKIHNLGQKC